MANKNIIKVGDVFCVETSDEYKYYFQYNFILILF